ncbi:MAG: chemotaxis protein CheW, partial [Deltaproteobacteria bacterium]|nr:chemotaxis protein CheW [Deltaproteobacteria bacterium]
VEIYEFVLENGEINVHQISPTELSEHFDVELDPFWLESSEEGSEYIDETMTPDDSSMSIEEKLKLQSAEHLNELKDRADYIEKLIKKIKKKPKSAKEDELNDLFRFFHNIHGDSGILGLTELTTISEPLETICDELRSGELKLTADIAVKLIHGVESIREYIGKFNSVPDNLVSSYSKDSPTVDTPNRINQDNIQPTQGQASLKIDAERLDALMEMVGELVIAQALVSQDEAMSNLADGRLEKNVSQVDKLTKNIQDQVMSLRLLPLKYTFSKMSRVVRDVSRRADKEVRLNVTGDETEVDKSIIDHIGDPLTHLVRNCVDHGIEGPEDRASAGKSFEGVVDLKAYHQGGSVVIEVLDDGAGLSREDIYNKAKEKGLLTEVMEHDDTKLFNVIFEPGFSTAKEITEISGRGVGLDVVKKDIEKLRGRVDVSSTKGEGTTFTLRFPLTTASIEGMVVKVGVDRYIIPTLSIETSFKPAASDITVVAGQGEVVKIRDELHPVIRLRKLFTDNGVGQDMKDSIFILVEGNGRKCCVVVDEILGHQHVVIKSLSDTFSGLIAISGCTILGDGRVGLILDVGGVVDVAFN